MAERITVRGPVLRCRHATLPTGESYLSLRIGQSNGVPITVRQRRGFGFAAQHASDRLRDALRPGVLVTVTGRGLVHHRNSGEVALQHVDHLEVHGLRDITQPAPSPTEDAAQAATT